MSGQKQIKPSILNMTRSLNVKTVLIFTLNKFLLLYCMLLLGECVPVVAECAARSVHLHLCAGTVAVSTSTAGNAGQL